MTAMQKIGLGIGLFVVLVRLPGAIWPEGYAERMRSLVLARPTVVRALGGILLLVALTIAVLIMKTLTFFQGVMLVLALLLAGSGIVMGLFPDPYRRVTDGMLASTPALAIRLVCILGVAIGLWIVYLSLSLA